MSDDSAILIIPKRDKPIDGYEANVYTSEPIRARSIAYVLVPSTDTKSEVENAKPSKSKRIAGLKLRI
jgi:hypothetical protein